MTTKAKTEKQLADEGKTEEEVKFDPSEYACEIILEKTTPDKAKDRQLPSDAFNVSYIHEDKEFLDVTRSGKMANIFDFYYDKYGNVKKIDYGHGTVNPSQWGYKKPERKKGKRKQ